MKRSIFLTVALLVNMIAFAQFSGLGAGTSTNPYLITNATQLNEMRNFLNTENVYFVLGNDIDLTSFIAENNPSEGWEPIGTNSAPFMGYFHGNGKSIKGLTINRPQQDYVGLFGNVKNSTILRVVIKNCNIIGGNVIGGLIGKMEGSAYATECGVTGYLSGTYTAGGLIGSMSGSRTVYPQIDNCYFNGDVYGNQGAYSGIGGIVGYNTFGGINKCYAAGTVHSGYYAGGIVGSFHNSGSPHPGYVMNCMAAVTKMWASNYVGRIIGNYDNYSYVSGGNKAYSEMEIYFQGSSTPLANNCPSGTDNGTSVSLSATVQSSTYTSMGWDFSTIWTIDETNSLPYFVWESQVEKMEQTLSFTQLPSMTYSDTSYTLPLNTDEGQTISWTSSNNNVAVLIGNVLIINGVGNATITANQAGNDEYLPFSRTYALTVTKSPLTITAKSYTVAVGATLPTFEIEYAGFRNSETATKLTTQPTISCSAVDCNTPGTYDIIVSGASSPNYDITYVNGTLTVEQANTSNNMLVVAPQKIHTGYTTTLSVSLDNEDTVVAFELDLQLPDGISIASDEDGELDVTLNSSRSNRHNLQVSDNGNGKYHILSYSGNNNAFKGNSGELLSITLTCDKEMEPGIYQGLFHTVKFIDNNEEYIMIADTNFDINVSNVLMGDVNADDVIDVMDIVMIVNHIMGSTSPKFVFAAADHDANNIVDVLDLVKEVRLIMDLSGAAAQAGTFDQEDGSLSLHSCQDGTITVGINSNERYVASQFTETLSAGQHLANVTTDNRHTVTYQPITDNQYKVVCYSTKNDVFTSNEGIINLEVTGAGSVSVENTLFVNADQEKVHFMDAIPSYTDGIGSLTVNPSTPSDIYNASGMLIIKGATSTEGLQSGIYIVNGKKVIVK